MHPTKRSQIEETKKKRRHQKEEEQDNRKQRRKKKTRRSYKLEAITIVQCARVSVH
jgi:hypothetical protein